MSEQAHDEYLRNSLLWAKDRVQSEAAFLGHLIDNRAEFERVPGRFAQMIGLAEQSMADAAEALLTYHGRLCRQALV